MVKSDEEPLGVHMAPSGFSPKSTVISIEAIEDPANTSASPHRRVCGGISHSDD